eukprot:1830986-Pyramimonas_sp.AAC.1
MSSWGVSTCAFCQLSGGAGPRRKWISPSEYEDMCVCVRATPMGWLSAVGVAQHVHGQIAVDGLRASARLAASQEPRRDQPFPVRERPAQRWHWRVYVDDSEDTEFAK